MLNKNSSLEELKKNLDFGVYGTFNLNSSNIYLLMGQKKIVFYEKNKNFKEFLYSDIKFLELIEVFSGGGIEHGLIPTRPNTIVLGNEIKIKLKSEEFVIPLDIDSETSIKTNKENLEKINELFKRFSPETEIKINHDPYFL